MAQQQPLPVNIKTARFLLRSLTAADVTQRYLDWSADPAVVTPLNIPATGLTPQQLAGYISQFDNLNGYLIGIFTLKENLHIGFHMIDINSQHRAAIFNVVIGDKDYWGEKVVLETRAALLDYVFERRNIEKAIGKPLARNFPAVFNYKAQGWQLEGILKNHFRSVIDGTRLDQYRFGLMREDWRALKKDQQHR